MFSHVRLGTNDVAKSKAFYDGALGALDIQGQDLGGTLMYRANDGMLMIGSPIEGAASHANGGTIGFKATSSEQVDRFHAAGLAAGGKCEGEPGVREQYGIYAAYLRDPDGNKICAIAQAAQ